MASDCQNGKHDFGPLYNQPLAVDHNILIMQCLQCGAKSKHYDAQKYLNDEGAKGRICIMNLVTERELSGEKPRECFIEFTLPSYGGKWVRLSGDLYTFDTIPEARAQCEKMGPVYFTCGETETRWSQRIIDLKTGNTIESFHDFGDIESEQESE